MGLSSAASTRIAPASVSSASMTGAATASAMAARASGRSRVKAAPRPGSLAAVIVPPMASVSSLQIASPRPVPPN